MSQLPFEREVVRYVKTCLPSKLHPNVECHFSKEVNKTFITVNLIPSHRFAFKGDSLNYYVLQVLTNGAKAELVRAMKEAIALLEKP